MRLGPLWALMVEVLGSPSPCPRTSGWGLLVGVMGKDAIGCYLGSEVPSRCLEEGTEGTWRSEGDGR